MAGMWERSFSGSQQNDNAGDKAADGISSFKLHLEFHGFCCFVPAPDGRSLGVFLPRAEKTERPGDVPEHAGVVRFHLSGVRGVGKVDAGVVSYWSPERHEIRVTYDGDTEDRDLDISGFRQGVEGGFLPLPVTAEPEPVLNWVLSVGDALRKRGRSGAVRLRPGLKLDQLDDTHASMLTARMMLTRGKVEVADFSRQKDDLVIWRLLPVGVPKDDAKDHLQFAAAVVRVVMDVPAPSVRIVRRHLEGGSEHTIVELAPETAEKPVVVRILNEEANAILELGSQPTIELGALRGQDQIFRAVAKLLDGDAGQHPFPVPIADRFFPVKPKPGSIRIAPPCSPMRVDG